MNKQTAQYQELHKEIQKILNSWDPLNLLSAEAPPDEYENEVTLILARLHHCSTKIDLEKALNIIFKNNFDYDNVASNANKQVDDIWAVRNILR